MTKCLGCGISLQTLDKEKIGYTNNIDNKFCLRCFKINNYSEYTNVIKDNEDYVEILKAISKTDDLVVLVVDVFDIPKKLADIRKIINNDIILVITKRDVLPLSLYDKNIIEYFKKYVLNPLDVCLVSSKKNYNFDNLFECINKYKTGKNVYVVGYTNAGKSTLINKLIYNYATDLSYKITVSSMPATTLDVIEVKLTDDLILIDTPGLLNENSFTKKLTKELAKKIIPRKEIKPLVYQIKNPQTIFIDEFVRLDLKNLNNLVFYFSNELKIERYYNKKDKLKDLVKHELKITKESDIVISGLGFINVKKADEIVLYAPVDVDVYLRDSLI